VGCPMPRQPSTYRAKKRWVKMAMKLLKIT
jgi:hypothetical protein